MNQQQIAFDKQTTVRFIRAVRIFAELGVWLASQTYVCGTLWRYYLASTA